MAVTYRLPQAGGALQNPAYRLADVFLRESVFEQSGTQVHVKKTRLTRNEGFGVTRRTPLQFRPQSFGDGPKDRTPDGNCRSGNLDNTGFARFAGAPD